VPLHGTPVDAIDLAEDRGRFGALLRRSRSPTRPTERRSRPRRRSRSPRTSASRCSCARATCSAAARWRLLLERDLTSTSASTSRRPGAPLLLDRFLENASRSTSTRSATANTPTRGIMQHRRGGRVHSGDSACVIPRRASARRCSTRSARPRADRALARRHRPDQHPVRGRGGKLHVSRRTRGLRGPCPSSARRSARRWRRCLPADARRDARRPGAAGDADRPRPGQEAVLPFNRFAGADAVLGRR